jgi:DNA repair exonuclease SbcCD nuclease subunit
MKFIHAADLHLDSPMRGLDSYEGAPVDELRGATRRALEALVDLALRERVALVLLAGDIFDRDLGDFHSAIYFRSQLLRLTRGGIRVFIVKGNHDAEGQIGRRLPEVDGVHVFSSRTSEVIDLPELGVAVHGRSFPDRVVTQDLVPNYRDPVPARFNIGLLHTSLSGSALHDPYAPTDVPTLVAKGYDYFALGHIHARQVVREHAPRIVYAGNLQGRHVGETGSKGCELVTVEDGRVVSADHVSLDVVRWHQLTLNVDGLDSITALARQFQQACRGLVSGAEDKLHTLRVRLQGETALQQQEALEPGTLAAALRAATQDFTQAQLWIESVELDLRSPLDRAALLQRDDALGEVLKLVDELSQDDAHLMAWVRARLEPFPPLPGELADAGREQLSLAQIKALLADAEATVLARLSSSSAA